MIDQADALRSLVRDKSHLDLPRRTRAYAVAITSGKGGVGKTSLAVNLALTLASTKGRVRLVDADYGLSNAEVLLGVNPDHTLEDVVCGRIDAADAWVDCPGGLRLISSGSGLDSMTNIDGVASAELMASALDSAENGDIIVIDTAPGIDDSVISILSMADEVLVVTTPEPTSITDCYATIKARTQAKPDCRISLVTNNCSSPSQAGSVARGLDAICIRFLGRSFQRYEYVPTDPSVGRAILTRRPFALHAAHTPAASWLKRLAIKIVERERQWQASRRAESLLEA